MSSRRRVALAGLVIYGPLQVVAFAIAWATNDWATALTPAIALGSMAILLAWVWVLVTVLDA